MRRVHRRPLTHGHAMPPFDMTGAPRTPEAYRAVLHGPSGRAPAGSCAVRAHQVSSRLPPYDSRVRSIRCGGVDEECDGQAKTGQVVARLLAATARSAPTRQCSRRPTWRSHALPGSADGGALPRAAAVGVVTGVGAQDRGDPGTHLVSSPDVPATAGHAAHAVRPVHRCRTPRCTGAASPDPPARIGRAGIERALTAVVTTEASSGLRRRLMPSTQG